MSPLDDPDCMPPGYIAALVKAMEKMPKFPEEEDLPDLPEPFA